MQWLSQIENVDYLDLTGYSEVELLEVISHEFVYIKQNVAETTVWHFLKPVLVEYSPSVYNALYCY